mgnify:CR=1 FL=1
MKELLLTGMTIYFVNMFICAVINIINKTRIPYGFIDFIKLTTLPYLLFNLEEAKKKKV